MLQIRYTTASLLEVLYASKPMLPQSRVPLVLFQTPAQMDTARKVSPGSLQPVPLHAVKVLEATHHNSDVSGGEGEGDVEAVAVPGAAAAHGVPQAQPAQWLQPAALPGPCPAQPSVITSGYLAISPGKSPDGLTTLSNYCILMACILSFKQSLCSALAPM